MSGIIGGAGSKSGVIGTTELDYEEGTWSPTLSGSGAGNGTVYANTAVYTKIGRVVLVSVMYTFPTQTDASGAYIIGLPFDVALGAGSQFSGSIGETSYSGTFNVDTRDANILEFRPMGSGGLSYTNLSGDDVRFSITYHTTS